MVSLQPRNHYNIRRMPCPQIWLISDARNDAVLAQSIKNLPRGSAIIFRHYHLGKQARAQRFAELARLARRYRHLMILADSPTVARQWGADGVHGRSWSRLRTGSLFHSAPVHNAAELRIAIRQGADAILLSPIFATRSHPGQRPLNIITRKRLIDLSPVPVILLGGMSIRHARQCARLNAHGWAAITALSHGAI